MLGMDCLLTAVIIYLLSDSFGSLIWAYLGLYTDPQMLKLGQRIEVPVGYAHFADPLSRPHPTASSSGPTTSCSGRTCPGGGHFGAFEQPQLVREDARKLLRLIRER